LVRSGAAGPDLRSQLAAIVEHSNDAIYSRSFDGIFITWNAAAERIFGFTAGEIIGQSSRLLLPPGADHEYRTLVERLRRGRVIEQFETERLRKDGRRIRVSLTLSPIRDASRRLVGYSTIARDVSEQRRVQETLLRREAELDDLFGEASVGLILVSPEGAVLRANQAFAGMLQRQPRDVVGRPLQDFQSEGSALDGLLQRVARRETLHNLATEFLTVKGETRFVLVDANGLWERGRLLHSRWFVRDITRRRRLERELLEVSERERRGFAQELHDGLGQQLGGVAYLCGVLRERLAERNSREAQSAERIFELVRKAIEDARRMARGLSPINEGPEGLMEALRELAAQTAELKGVRCRLNCRGTVLVPDSVVAGHLYRIAQEAVNNAIKHGRSRTITVSLRHTDGRLILAVLDDGRGIGPLSPNRKGLGLRIMQYRAGLIRGTLDVAPRQARGTEVVCTVSLPAGVANTRQN
jgi:PAS domain S-box-containing protein